MIFAQDNANDDFFFQLLDVEATMIVEANKLVSKRSAKVLVMANCVQGVKLAKLWIILLDVCQVSAEYTYFFREITQR